MVCVQSQILFFFFSLKKRFEIPNILLFTCIVSEIMKHREKYMSLDPAKASVSVTGKTTGIPAIQSSSPVLNLHLVELQLMFEGHISSDTEAEKSPPTQGSFYLGHIVFTPKAFSPETSAWRNGNNHKMKMFVCFTWHRKGEKLYS